MKHLLVLFFIASFLIGCNGAKGPAPGTGEAGKDSVEAGTNSASDVPGRSSDLEALVSGHDLDTYRSALADLDDDAASALGLTALLNRDPALAAWFYSVDLESNADDPSTMNQLGMLLHELYYVEDDRELLDDAISLLTQAADSEKTRAEPANNLAYALLERYELDGDEADLQTAIDMLVRALDLAPDEAIYQARLAQLQLAMGDEQTAMMSLGKAQQLDPINIVAFDVGSRASGSAAFAEIDRSYCDEIDYCSSCPKSIIGQINFVTCKMVEADWIGECKAGRPYPPTYDCAGELPTFGILIPGLNSGFSILTPFGSIDMTVDGEGKIKWQVQFKRPGGLVEPSYNFSGTWDPESGLVVTNTGPEMTLVLRGRGKAKDLMNAIERQIGSVGISMKSDKNLGTGETTTSVGIKAVRGEVWSTH